MAALVPFLIHLGLANAQIPSVPGVPNPVAASSSAGNNAVVSSSGNAGITPGVNLGGVLPSEYTLPDSMLNVANDV